MVTVIWTLHSFEGIEYYRGPESSEAQRIIGSCGGISVLRSYHLTGGSVAVNESVYDGEKEQSHTLRYISCSEIEIILDLLGIQR